MRLSLYSIAVLAAAAFCAAQKNEAHAVHSAPVFMVTSSTVIAFFPITADEIKRSPEDAESLSDFVAYLAKARVALNRVGVDVHEIRTGDFLVQVGSHTRRFRARAGQVGYYFVSPKKEPRIEYGISTDDDILAIAQEHFGVFIQ